MSLETKGKKVIYEGFTHDRHYFYISELKMPDGYVVVEKGKTQSNDMVMVQVPPFPKAKSFKRYLGKKARIKARWEIIDKENIHKDVSQFRAVIRHSKISN